MATKPREWPNNAKEARDSAAEAIQDALKALDPILEEGRLLTHDEIVLRVARAIRYDTTAIRWLESVGAPTRPREV